MRRPLVTQCGLFALEHALAAVLGEYGVRPVAVAGHSIGQYAAAVAAEALTLEQAAALVAARAGATEALNAFSAGGGAPARGGMLAVTGDDARIEQWAAGRADVWIAVRNAPRTLVLAGAQPALADAARALAALGCRCRPVPVSHPFHTPLMQPVADAIIAQRIAGAAPRIPMTCNVTGGWLGADAASPGYWARHLLEPVRWSDNVAALLRWQPDVVLEIGPGTVLCSLIGKHLAGGANAGAPARPNGHAGANAAALAPRVLPTLPAAGDDAHDAAHFCNTIGQLWCAGVPIDWRAYHAHEAAAPGRALARVPLPGYAFERDSYWTRRGRRSMSTRRKPMPNPMPPRRRPITRTRPMPTARAPRSPMHRTKRPPRVRRRRTRVRANAHASAHARPNRDRAAAWSASPRRRRPRRAGSCG